MTAPIPGETLPADEPVVVNQGRETTTVDVENTGDRPVQVGSHFHFFEVNPALTFDREAAYGFRLDVPAGTAVRFEPGQTQSVDLVAIGGDRVVRGFGGLVNGPLDDETVRERAMERAEARGYLGGVDRGGSLQERAERTDDSGHRSTTGGDADESTTDDGGDGAGIDDSGGGAGTDDGGGGAGTDDGEEGAGR